MKRSLFTIIYIFICLNVTAQHQYFTPLKKTRNINLNDTTYMRILNGIVINNDYLIKDFDRVTYIRVKEDIVHLELTTDKPVMIIEIETSDIENKIDSILYSRPDFIKDYKYPLDIQLPISINGKLLSNDEKKYSLSKITLSQVKRVEYWDNKSAEVNRSITPFGVINLKTK